jgi:DNA-binding CsgD family transcriptional regulator
VFSAEVALFEEAVSWSLVYVTPKRVTRPREKIVKQCETIYWLVSLMGSRDLSPGGRGLDDCIMKLDALSRTGENLGCTEGCGCLDCAVRALLKLLDSPELGANDAQEILLDTYVDGARYLFVRVPQPIEAGTPLSPREQEIVRMVSRGNPNKVIAEVLNISPWTVCTHLRRIFAKLGVTSRAAMVAKVMSTPPCDNVTLGSR